MQWGTRSWSTRQDLENFYMITFDMAKKYIFTSKELATLSDQELFQKHRSELAAMDFRSPERELIIAETATGMFLGALWVARREQGDPWDRVDRMPAWVYDVQVLPAHRRQGVGRGLMLAAEDWAREQGYSEIGLHTASWLPGARNLYLGLGYADQAWIACKRPHAGKAASTPEGISVQRWHPEKGKEVLAPMWSLRRQAFEALTADDEAASGGPEQPSLYPRFKPVLPVDQPGYQVFVALEKPGGGYVGGLVAREFGGALWILEVGVLPARRRRGAGRALLEAAEASALSMGGLDVKVFYHLGCAEAHKMLARAGFEPADYYMRKAI